MRPTGQVSSASGISVWLVYENTFDACAHASAHAMPCSSVSTRISSATPMAGWVSLRWIATLSDRLPKPPCSARWRDRMSATEAATKKYSCLSRSSRPAGVLSFG